MQKSYLIHPFSINNKFMQCLQVFASVSWICGVGTWPGATHSRRCRPFLEDCDWLGCGPFRLRLQDDCSASGYFWVEVSCCRCRAARLPAVTVSNNTWSAQRFHYHNKSLLMDVVYVCSGGQSFASHSDRWTETALRRWLTANALHDRRARTRPLIS